MSAFSAGVTKAAEEYSILNPLPLMPSETRIKNKPIERETISQTIRRIKEDPTIPPRKKNIMIRAVLGWKGSDLTTVDTRSSYISRGVGAGLGGAAGALLAHGRDWPMSAKAAVALLAALGGGSLAHLMKGPGLVEEQGTKGIDKWNL